MWHPHLWRDATTAMEEEKERLLRRRSEDTTRNGRHRYPPVQWGVYSVCVHFALGLSLIANVYLGHVLDAQKPPVFCKKPSLWHTWATTHSRDHIVPELRRLRYVTKAEHATNHTRYSVYSGPPSEQNAESWTQLLQRGFSGQR